MDFIMERVLPFVLLLVLLGLCFILGAASASMALEGGSFAVLGAGIVASLIMGAVLWWLAFMFFDMSMDSPKAAGAVVGALAVVVTMVVPVSQLVWGHQDADYLRQMAPVVRSFGLEHFSEIDADHNELITDQEMEASQKSTKWSAEDRATLDHMRDQQSEVGHVIDSYTTTTYVWISTGKTGGYMSPVITTHYVYGINKADLNAYPAKVVAKYKKW